MVMLKKYAFVFFIFSLVTHLAVAEVVIELKKTYSKEYYSNGNLKAEGWISNAKKEGYWKFYYRNGSLKKEGHISKNKPTKYWYFYRENGTLESEGHFSKGTKNMWWLFYDGMEKIYHKCQLKNNKKDGYCLRYTNEKLVKAEKYRAGKKIKEWTDFRSFKKENKLSDLQ